VQRLHDLDHGTVVFELELPAICASTVSALVSAARPSLGYGDPGRGLAEMARVARPDTPIVVVDEQLDPASRQSPFHRLVFRALTFYTTTATSPVAHLPAGATAIVSEQLSRYYYCLTFRVPRPYA
jgi:hypothetical protein